MRLIEVDTRLAILSFLQYILQQHIRFMFKL